MLPPLTLEQTIEKTVREEWGRILAALVKTLGDLQLAEDCLQDAIMSAMNHWQKQGLPRVPAAWLITTARRKAIDRLRRDRTFSAKQGEIAYLIELDGQKDEMSEEELIPDKRLEMIFTCCHPALEEKTRVALTLRTLGGLTTEEIARAFLDRPDAMQQRLTRAKKKIALAGIPYRIPDRQDLPSRISSVLNVLYLIFNEGYSATSGEGLSRVDLSEEAIRLGYILSRLLPDETEVAGLLALMLLHDARRIARTGADGVLIPLDRQNRARWNRTRIAEGVAILKRNLPRKRLGPYQIQAAISAVHAQSPDWASTDWHEITALYDLLLTFQPTSVVRVNQAVAISYARCPAEALSILDDLAGDGEMERYQPYHAARADILGRSGRHDEALECFDRAIALSHNLLERRFLEERAGALRAECNQKAT